MIPLKPPSVLLLIAAILLLSVSTAQAAPLLQQEQLDQSRAQEAARQERLGRSGSARSVWRRLQPLPPQIFLPMKRFVSPSPRSCLKMNRRGSISFVLSLVTMKDASFLSGLPHSPRRIFPEKTLPPLYLPPSRVRRSISLCTVSRKHAVHIPALQKPSRSASPLRA